MTDQAPSLATKDELLALTGARRFRTVTLPVSKLTLRLRSLTEGEVSAYHTRVSVAGSVASRSARLQSAARRLFALCLVDAEGNRLLSDDEAETLGEKLDAADAQVLYDACSNHTGINQADVESLVKNSGATGDGD